MEEKVENKIEEELEFEYEEPSRHENMSIVSMVYEMYKNEDTMTANATKRKQSVMNKCLKIGKRYIDEIFDETFYVEAKDE